MRQWGVYRGDTIHSEVQDIYQTIALIQRKKAIRTVKKPTYWHIQQEKEVAAG